MAEPVGVVSIELEANLRALTASLRTGERTVSAFGTNVTSVLERIDRRFGALGAGATKFGAIFGKALGVGLGGFAVTELLSKLKDVAGDLAKIGDTADAIGVTTSALQALRFASEQAGGSAEAVDTGLKKFSQNIAEAGTGTGELLKVLTLNNVALRESDGRLRSVSDLFAAYGDLVKGAANPQDQLRLATLAFGRAAGPELVGLLKEGRAGIRDLAGEAEKAGAIVEERLVRKAQEIDDKFDKLSRTIGTQVKGAIIQIVAGMQEFMNLLDRATGGETPTEKIGERIVEITKEMVKWEDALAVARKQASETGLKVDQESVALIERRIDALKREEAALQARGHAVTLGGPEAPKTPSPPVTKIPISDEAKKLDEFQKATRSLRERTAELEREAQAVGKSTYENAKSRAELQLMQAAERAGIPITAERRAEIDKVSTAYAQNTVALEKAEGSYKKVLEQQQFFADQAFSAIDDLVINGKELDDVLSDLTKSFARAALQAALLGTGPFGSAQSNGQVGGLFGSLITGLKGAFGFAKGGIARFAGGGAISGPGSGKSDSILARLSNGEFVVNATSTAKHRSLLEAINADRLLGFASGGFAGNRGFDAAFAETPMMGRHGGWGEVLA
jgi:hypothetical protein